MQDRENYIKKAIYTTRTCRFWVQNNIIFVNIFQGTVLDHQDAEENLAAMEKIYKFLDPHFPYALLVDMHGIKSVSKEAIEIFTGAGLKSAHGSGVLALIVRNALERIIGNLILTIRSPDKPTRLFTDLEKATQWLEKYTMAPRIVSV